MSAPGRARWLRRLRLLSVGLHVLFVLSAPFEHHDLLCHLKTPTHCTSCAFSPLSASPKTVEVVGRWTLADAGRALDSLPIALDVVFSVQSSGRSPPPA